MGTRWAFSALAILSLASRTVLAGDTLMPSIVHEACAEFAKGEAFEINARFDDNGISNIQEACEGTLFN